MMKGFRSSLFKKIKLTKKFHRRHIAKTITWRLIGTLDTFVISIIITGNIQHGLAISGLEILTKSLLYYFHEQYWININISAKKRHVVKTFTWRIIGSLDTFLLSFLVTKKLFYGISIGAIETLSKMVLYFFHEKIWYQINYGLDKRSSTIKKFFR